jgi:hypothetical protein
VASVKADVNKALRAMFAPTLWLLSRAEMPALFLVKGLPEKMIRLAARLHEKGEAMCYGPEAHRTIAPGILLREAGKMAEKPARSGNAHLFWYVTSTACAFGGAAQLGLGWGATLLFGTAALPLAVGAVAVAGMTALMMAGAALHALPALFNLPVGYKRRAEYFRQAEERRIRSWDAPEEMRHKLPPLDDKLHDYRQRMMRSAPHERVEWFEALKEKFPEDFARAAVPGGADIDPGLADALRIRKSPLKLRAPAAPYSRTTIFSRMLRR